MTRRGLPVGPPPEELMELPLDPAVEESPFLRPRQRTRVRSRRRGFAPRALLGVQVLAVALLAVVGNEQAEPFAVKKSLLALGRIGDPRAVPAVVRMLYAERPGGTFFPDAAFAASQIGPPMAAPLTAVLQGRDPALESWAGAHGVHPAALRAKAAQLLGDVGGAEAVPALLGALGYVDGEPAAQLFVRVFAAESLGRLRAREAVAPVGAILAKERDPDARERYADAEQPRCGEANHVAPLRVAQSASSTSSSSSAPAAYGHASWVSTRSAARTVAPAPATVKRAWVVARAWLFRELTR